MMVSIIMITYNHQNYIRQAIEGVLMQQTSFSFELIIANDNSPDDTCSVVSHIIKNHPKGRKIKYIDRNENIGTQSNFLDVYNRCQGKYIALCEGDDYWTDPLKLQKQVDFLDANLEYIVCYHDCNVVNAENEILTKSFLKEFKKDYTNEELKLGAWMPTLTRCFRNDRIVLPKEFCMVTCGDLFLTSILGLYGKGKYLDFNGANYREHNGGVWSSRNQFQKELIMINDYRKMCVFWRRQKELGVYNFFHSSLVKTHKKAIEIAIRKHDYVSFFKVIRLNLIFDKSFFRFSRIYQILNLVKVEFYNSFNS
jgi:glycosyltransferase involved in cell wall biosynthesis